MPTLTIADISELLLELGLDGTVTERDRALANTALRQAAGAVCQYLRYNPVYQSHVEYYPQGDHVAVVDGSVWDVDDNRAYVRNLSVGAGSQLQIANLPIRSISSLKIDYDGRAGTRSGSFGAGTLKTSGSDYWMSISKNDSNGDPVCMDGIINSVGLWPTAPGCVKIEYTSGYKATELRGADSILNASPIWESVILEAQRRFLTIKSRSKKALAGWAGPLSSENLGDYSYSQDASITGNLIGTGTALLGETVMRLEPFVRMDWGVL